MFDPDVPKGTTATNWLEDVYSSGAATPSKKNCVPESDVATRPASSSCRLVSSAGPRFAPKITTTSPGATESPRKLAPLTSAEICGGPVSGGPGVFNP